MKGGNGRAEGAGAVLVAISYRAMDAVERMKIVSFVTEQDDDDGARCTVQMSCWISRTTSEIGLSKVMVLDHMTSTNRLFLIETCASPLVGSQENEILPGGTFPATPRGPIRGRHDSTFWNNVVYP
jgi:hypothetical protein